MEGLRVKAQAAALADKWPPGEYDTNGVTALWRSIARDLGVEFGGVLEHEGEAA